MRFSFRLQTAICAAVCLVHPLESHAQEADYPNPPEILKDRVDTAVRQMARYYSLFKSGDPSVETLDQVPSAVAGSWLQLVLYTLGDALAPDQSDVTVRKLKAYQALGQTARTDKQIGAAASAAGSTSVSEKPGLPLLLGFAIDHGAIEQKVSGTTATLSSSPYALVALTTGGDTSENYQKYHFWRLISGSAVFNLQNTQVPVAEQISRKDLSQYSIRFRIWGDRDTRSPKFKKIWESTVGTAIQRKVNEISNAEAQPFGISGSPLVRKSDATLGGLLKELSKELDKHSASGETSLTENDQATLAKMVLGALRQNIFDGVKNGDITITDQEKDFVNNHMIPSLLSVQQDLEEARMNLDKVLAPFNKSPLLTFEYTYNRPDMQVLGMSGTGSNYGDFKLLFEGYVAPVDVIANAGISTYPHANHNLNQSQTRDYHADLTIEGKSNSPFHTNEKDFSKVTYSVSGRFERMLESHANIGVFQVKIEIPLAAGLSLPLSLTYANRTEFIKEKEVRGNFGFSFDFDKLYMATSK